MSGQRNAAPVIIKRKKIISGGGHHGGAWKVAYADFVTAMMAFFLLMWLLSATTEKQRKGIADYFSPTVPISRVSGGGDGMFGGDSVFSEDTIAQVGPGASAERPTEQRQASGATGVEISDAAGGAARSDPGLRDIERRFQALGGESTRLDSLMRHVVTRVTDEGLIVELFDLPGEPLFAADSADPQPITAELARMLIEVFALVSNGVAVNGHVRSYPIVLEESPVWELSTARAQQMRGLLETAGFAPERISRVTGKADREPAVRNPMSDRNNRLELILLRSKT